MSICWCNCVAVVAYPKYHKGPDFSHIIGEVTQKCPLTKPSCIVGLHHCVGHLWRWNHRKCFHDAIWIFLAHFGDQQRSHASTSAAAKGVAKLESLQAITPLSFFSDHVQDRVNQLSALGVVTLTGSGSLNGTLKVHKTSGFHIWLVVSTP